MPEKTAYETGARKLMTATGPDPNDDFSQEAAENRKPRDKYGLTRKVEKSTRKPKRPVPAEYPSQAPDPNEQPTRDVREAPAPNPEGNAEKRQP